MKQDEVRNGVKASEIVDLDNQLRYAATRFDVLFKGVITPLGVHDAWEDVRRAHVNLSTMLRVFLGEGKKEMK